MTKGRGGVLLTFFSKATSPSAYNRMDTFEAEDEDFNNLLNKAKQKMETVRASSIANYERHKLDLKGANGDIEDAAKCVR